MTNASDNDGFLGRWSRRKTAVRDGQNVPEAQPPAPSAALVASPVQAPEPRATPEEIASATPAAPEPPVPTLEDAQKLTPQSDFKPFMARNVSPEVKNTALKKLFADPHFNKMDMLDVYVDDYGKPDPIPASMLRQLASAQFLKLFDDEEKKQARPGDDANPNPEQAVAHLTTDAADTTASNPEVNSTATPSEPSAQSAPPATHDHPDLQLQPNHAAGRPSPGPSAG
jgi:hypothetical protein